MFTPLILCTVLWVHDGDTFRCKGYDKSTRLHAIDAPEMLGSCAKGRKCTKGDPYASRDYLKKLIGKRELECKVIEIDRYKRPVMNCWAGKTNLSCAMVKSGHAVERYGKLKCKKP